MAAGEDYHAEVELMRAAERQRLAQVGAGRAGRKRRKAGDCLRERDPW